MSESDCVQPGEPELLSIGHSTQSLEDLVALLQQHRIEVVGDVRTSPFSRFNPQFNRRDLQLGLNEAGIQYVFLGAELGGRPDGDEFYDPDSHVLYGRMAETPEFKAGLSRLLDGTKRFRVAMMCSEEDPVECHRFLLITRVLHGEGSCGRTSAATAQSNAQRTSAPSKVGRCPDTSRRHFLMSR